MTRTRRPPAARIAGARVGSASVELLIHPARHRSSVIDEEAVHAGSTYRSARRPTGDNGVTVNRIDRDHPNGSARAQHVVDWQRHRGSRSRAHLAKDLDDAFLDRRRPICSNSTFSVVVDLRRDAARAAPRPARRLVQTLLGANRPRMQVRRLRRTAWRAQPLDRGEPVPSDSGAALSDRATGVVEWSSSPQRGGEPTVECRETAWQ